MSSVLGPTGLRIAALLFKWQHDAGSTLDGYETAEAFLDAHADAWEACEEQRHVQHLETLRLTGEVRTLRQRLKAAEMAMLDAAVKLRDYETPDAELDKVADRLAALAAGEKT